MSYLVIARKYRPDTFTSVIGQKHVTAALANAIKNNQVAHAYVFSGPRGVGKTSIARILSKSLNCAAGPTAQPCGTCNTCEEVKSGRSLAVREIDGASHNSVDNVRELIDSFRALPPPGYKYKVYIIDEVHMLSTSAFNALLKSLEEPPPNTIFILATTEKHKIPKTILSRCQEYEFKSLTTSEIVESLERVCKSENIKIDKKVLFTIARLAEGSMRDSQTLLDRIKAFCDGDITEELAAEAIGTVSRNTLCELVDKIIAREPATALEILESSLSQGRDVNLFLKEFVSFWRDLLLCAVIGETAKIDLGLTPEDFNELLNLAKPIELIDLQDLVEIARRGADAAIRSHFPRFALESLIVRMCTRLPVRDLNEVVNNLREKLKDKNSEPQSNLKTNKIQNKVESKVNSPVQEKNNLDHNTWTKFVDFVFEDGNLMLAEQLRRVVAEKFSDQTLTLRGPEFSVAYIQNKENLSKLYGLLESYSNVKWRIECVSGATGVKAEPGSLLEVEQSKKTAIIKVKADNLRNHPSVQKIKEIFPGSVIEDLKIKN